MYKLKSADLDIDDADLSVYWGGNGDIYVTIYDKTGAHSVRVCYSGGPDREIGIRSAMAKVAKEFLELCDDEEKARIRKYLSPGF